MKNGLLFLLLIFFSCTESSPKFSKKDIYYIERDKETGWFRVHNKQNKWGFIDKDSSIVIPFEYDFLNPFENGLAYAKNGRKEFFITKKNLKLEGDFDEVRIFSFGLAGVRKNRKWGFIDEKGKLIIQPIYDKIQYFTVNGLCPVVKNGKSGFIDKTGKEIIPIIYDDARSQQLDDIVIVQKNKRWAFFDNKGKQLSDFVFDEVFSTEHYDFSKDIFDRSQSTYFKNGVVLVRNGKNYEFINEKIKPAFPNNKFDSATVFDAFKNAIVKRNGKYGMIKSDGQIKVPLEYNFIEPYDSNHGNYSEYFNARKGKVYSIFNKNLRKIGESLEPIYNNFRTDNPTISFKNLKGKYGVIDKNGNVKVPFVYDEELRFEEESYAIATKNNEVGLIDSHNKILIPFGKQFIDEVFDRLDDKPKELANYFIVTNDNTAKIVDVTNKTIVNDYQSIRPLFYDHSKFLVKKNEKFGVIDLTNKILSPIIYDEFSDWVEYGPENRHIVKLGSKSGMLEEKTFKVKIPVDYNFVFISRFVVFVEKNKKYGIIDLNNKILCPLIYDELKPNFGYGLGFGDDKIYARKGKQYFEIDINGKILKSVTKAKFIEESKEPEPPPPPPKIK
ncbi:MAG: WG repeat-containing protein [Chryseobacterium sp.]|nr:WG repeat-containing protein [Chryseobacterium sp.]MBP7498580.1 WG repeat-containing protein [Chryseobacterium sp.]